MRVAPGTETAAHGDDELIAVHEALDVPVKFVVGSCQDYVGRYYNTWQRMLQLDVDADAIVFLGDYIYETTGDPAFQSVFAKDGVYVFKRVGTGAAPGPAASPGATPSPGSSALP